MLKEQASWETACTLCELLEPTPQNFISLHFQRAKVQKKSHISKFT